MIPVLGLALAAGACDDGDNGDNDGADTTQPGSEGAGEATAGADGTGTAGDDAAGSTTADATTGDDGGAAGCGDDEPNDDASSANALALGTPAAGTVCAGDEDWFALTPSGDFIGVDVLPDNDGAEGSVKACLYDATGTTEIYCPPGEGQFIHQSVTPGTALTIKVTLGTDAGTPYTASWFQ